MSKRKITINETFVLSSKKLNSILNEKYLEELDEISKAFSIDNVELFNKQLEDYINLSSKFLEKILNNGKDKVNELVEEKLNKDFHAVTSWEYVKNSEDLFTISDGLVKIKENTTYIRNAYSKNVNGLYLSLRDFQIDSKETIILEVHLTDEVIKVPLNKMLLVASYLGDGRLDLYLKFNMLSSIANSIGLDSKKYPIIKSLSNAALYVIAVLENGNQNKFHKAEYDKMVSTFTHNTFLSEHVETLFKLVNLFQTYPDSESVLYLEKLIIQLLGHWNEEVSEEAVVLLNMLYDNNNFQEKHPLETEIKRRNQELTVKYKVYLKDKNEIQSTINSTYCFINKPSEKGVYALNYTTARKVTVTNIIDEFTDNKVELLFEFKLCSRVEVCGYYDFHIVHFNLKDGRFGKHKMSERVREVNINDNYQIGSPNEFKIQNKQKNDEDQYDDEPIFEEHKGRFIVINEDVDDLSIHEVFTDFEKRKDEENKPHLTNKRSDFKVLTSRLKEYKEKHINCLYIMGALERDNLITFAKTADKNLKIMTRVDNPEASPMAITCRATISSLLGGDIQFNELLKQSKQLNMKIIIDSLQRISSSRAHRRYRDLYLNKLDDKGKINYIYGTEGHSVSYEDSALLNYRLKECWDSMVDDLISLVKKYDIDGVHLDSCQTWPIIKEVNINEMFRKDVDGIFAYSDEQILSGKVVISNEEAGYWSSDNSDYYPNPFLIKITKEVWKYKPNFLFVGECWLKEKFSNRHVVLLRSGIVPRMYTLPRAISRVLGRRIHSNGFIEYCIPEKVSIIRKFLEENYQFCPKGSRIIQSSSGQVWPYPALLYSRGNWAAVDLIFTLMDLPMTFMNEIYGEAYRVQITSIYDKKDLPNVEKTLKAREKSRTRLNELGRLPSQRNIKSEDIINENDPNIEIPKWKGAPKISSRHSITNLTEEINKVKKDVEEIGTTVSLSGVSKESEDQIKWKQEEIMRQVGPEFGFDLNMIHLHYEHRRKLRNKHECLKKGELIYLNTSNESNEPHPFVLAYARRSENETGVIIINFSFFISYFKIDFQELLKGKQTNSKTVCFVQNWQTEDKGENQLLCEILAENSTKQLNVSIKLK